MSKPQVRITIGNYQTLILSLPDAVQLNFFCDPLGYNEDGLTKHEGFHFDVPDEPFFFKVEQPYHTAMVNVLHLVSSIDHKERLKEFICMELINELIMPIDIAYLDVEEEDFEFYAKLIWLVEPLLNIGICRAIQRNFSKEKFLIQLPQKVQDIAKSVPKIVVKENDSRTHIYDLVAMKPILTNDDCYTYSKFSPKWKYCLLGDSIFAGRMKLVECSTGNTLFTRNFLITLNFISRMMKSTCLLSNIL